MKRTLFMVLMIMIAVYHGLGKEAVIADEAQKIVAENVSSNGNSAMVGTKESAATIVAAKETNADGKAEAQPHFPGFKISAGVDINFIDGFGGSFDFLFNDHFDIALGAYGMWNKSAYGFRGIFRYLLNIKLSVKVYPFAGAGYCKYSLDTLLGDRPLRQTLQMAEYLAGAGAYYAFGNQNRHAVLFELGYRYAQTEYLYNSHTLIGQNDYQQAEGKIALRPLYVNIGYRFTLFNRQ